MRNGPIQSCHIDLGRAAARRGRCARRIGALGCGRLTDANFRRASATNAQSRTGPPVWAGFTPIRRHQYPHERNPAAGWISVALRSRGQRFGANAARYAGCRRAAA